VSVRLGFFVLPMDLPRDLEIFGMAEHGDLLLHRKLRLV
jgi:hypothetical protein